MIIRCYKELARIESYEERFRYLKLSGQVGESTFGFDRYLNQIFYKSKEWLSIRDYVIVRDNGCDLGIRDREIHGRILIHHINPLSKEDILFRSDLLLNPEYLISTTKSTHDAIHYGKISKEDVELIVRTKGDTCPWKK